MLFDLTDGTLSPVAQTSFARQQLQERRDVQAAVRDRIEVLGGDLLVVAEEFGDFEDAHRRIDLLCVDRAARLVVVELKRTEDGGHMELQALRYAAMVSVMTFDELVETYAKHRRTTAVDDGAVDVARTSLVEWLDDQEGDEPVVSREVGIVLAAANFSQEITTTVLWLNEFYGMDVRCVRLSLYEHRDRLLLDAQQVVPLPEAAELTVRIKRREAAVKKAKESTKDYTRYVVRGPRSESDALPKRRAVLETVRRLHDVGVPLTEVATLLPKNSLLFVENVDEGDDLWLAFAREHRQSESRRQRWFLDDPIREEGRVWLLTNNGWGARTEAVLSSLVGLAPEQVSVHAAT